MIKALSLGKALVLGCLACAALPIACGESEGNPKPVGAAGDEASGGSDNAGGTGGSGGSVPLPPGISPSPSTIECPEGGMSCSSAAVPIQSVYVSPCCAGPDQDSCGLETGFLSLVGAAFDETCQAKNQPGAADDSCPSPDPAMVPVGGAMATLDPFPGCCKPDGTCGVLVNSVVLSGLPLATFNLGCVDAAPFFADAAPVPCGEGVGVGGSGAGGQSSGGAPSVAAGADAGGAAGVAGAAGGAAGSQ